MLFNSYEFVFGFLPLTFVGFLLLSRYLPDWRGAFIAIASIAFYAWWDARYVPLLLISISFNYGMGYAIAHANEAPKRAVLTGLAIAVDLAALAYYKYTGFLLDNVAEMTGHSFNIYKIILPLGISFYTFTQIAFIVDVYRGEAMEYSFRNYVLFVCYFPHLIAGPIIHHKSMMPQFESREIFRVTSVNVSLGAFFFLVGMLKKVVLADTFADYSDPVFLMLAQGGRPDVAISWIGAMSYAFQLYFDFSGYCDMAIGISLLFGVQLPLNFNSPYKASSIIDFWRRWHMTLSAFLREYLYFALGGARKGPRRRYVNLMLTMLLGGLWHGASWTFVVWGGLHGIYLVVNHGWRALAERVDLPRLGLFGPVLSVATTFLAVIIAWIFFRAESLEAATRLIGGMFGLNGTPRSWAELTSTLSDVLGYQEIPSVPITAIALGLFICWFLPNTQELAERGRLMFMRLRWSWMGASAMFTSMVLAIHSSRGVSPFIYFNF